MDNGEWVQLLEMLCARFSSHGVGADLSALSLDDLWGLYRFLSRLSEEG